MNATKATTLTCEQFKYHLSMFGSALQGQHIMYGWQMMIQKMFTRFFYTSPVLWSFSKSSGSGKMKYMQNIKMTPNSIPNWRNQNNGT